MAESGVACTLHVEEYDVSAGRKDWVKRDSVEDGATSIVYYRIVCLSS